MKSNRKAIDGSSSVPCSPSSLTPETDAARTADDSRGVTGNHVAAYFARNLEIERNDAQRDRDEWKAKADQYRRANASLDKAWAEMLALLRRIARKGEFMDREGLRLTVADWLTRRHLSENDKLEQPTDEKR